MLSNQEDLTPEALQALRESVKEWLKKARRAVWSFAERDGVFIRDSYLNDFQLSLTTSTRAYMALAYASRHLSDTDSEGIKAWSQSLEKYLSSIPLAVVHESDGIVFKTTEDADDGSGDRREVSTNNFELAHLADLGFAIGFAKRFGDESIINLLKNPNLKVFNKETGKNYSWEEMKSILIDQIAKRLDNPQHTAKGQMFFDKEQHESKHFFVTLHALRSLFVMEPSVKQKLPREDIVKEARDFCVEQCLYAERGIAHQQDPARLVFASLVYCLYSREVDNELIIAIIEAIASCQLASGKWPATHPVVRKRKDPWYIASHELALCLTWLYFQPRVPDSSRILLLRMMEKYFRNWILPTYLEIEQVFQGRKKVRRGWYDDRVTGHQVVVGWATAIVCHFLSNYMSVIDDALNRSVIESLDLQAYASDFLIAETEPKRSERWQTQSEPDFRPVWPDLPPIAWSSTIPSISDLAKNLSWHWTDPSSGNKLSKKLAGHVLLPIMKNSRSRPDKMVAGILNGPPGTRKTSLVRTISNLLGWPYIPVPASVIFDTGFDHMEARASQVFKRLNYLTSAVVFFDEFEEFFRERGQKQKDIKTHNRTIAAFTTASMLPRLQDLHDKERCLVFLATNHLEGIDEAIIRTGRFDFREDIGYPKRKKFIRNDGFLEKTTKRMCEQLSIELDAAGSMPTDKGLEELKALAQPVRRALKSVPKGQLRFGLAELALRAVKSAQDEGRQADELDEAAHRAIKMALRSSTVTDKGPPRLPPLDAI